MANINVQHVMIRQWRNLLLKVYFKIIFELLQIFLALNRFIVKLEDIEVFEREDVNLKCETKDTKTPGTWFRNGKMLSSMPGGKFETQSRSGTHVMKISKIEMNEADKYEIDVGGLKGSCNVRIILTYFLNLYLF